MAKRNEDGLYWRFIDQHKAYIIRAYVLRHGSIIEAAEALGISYHGLRKEIIRLRKAGFIEKDEEPKPGLADALEHLLPGKPASEAQKNEHGGAQEDPASEPDLSPATAGGDEGPNDSEH